MPYLTENYLVEKPAINWFQDMGYSYVHGSYLIPDGGERESYRHCVLKRRFLKAIQKLNPWLTDTLAEEVYKRVIELDHPDFIIKGKLFYDLLTNGVKLTFKEGKEERIKIVKLIDFESIENNDFLMVNQFKVEYHYEREQYIIPDLIVFIIGIPIAVLELKSFNAEETAKDAFLDHQIKIKDIPQLYVYSQIIVASDGYKIEEGKELDLTEEELVFYDRLLKEGIFANKEEIIHIVKEIQKELGYYVKIVDWHKKDSIRARIKTIIKVALAKSLGGRIEYQKIDKLSSELCEQLEFMYAA